MKPMSALILLLAVAGALSADTAQPAPEKEIPLYAGVAPGSENWNWSERTIKSNNGMPVAQNVVRPVLQYYPAPKAKSTGTAMIVAPGGG